VDINHSGWDSTLEAADFDAGAIHRRHRSMAGIIASRHAVRLGLRQIKGLARADADRLTACRGKGYDSVRDLWLRSGLDMHAVLRLAEADAFGSLGLDRRAALWAAQALGHGGDRLPLFDRQEVPGESREPEVLLPTMPPGEQVIHDYRHLALSLKAHPVSFLRRRLAGQAIVPASSLASVASGRQVAVAGLVLVRQRPGSAGGVIFLTLEDETGIANIILWPKLFERFRAAVMGGRLLQVMGPVQNEAGVVHVVARRIEDLSPWLADLAEAPLPVRQAMPKGRNFH